MNLCLSRSLRALRYVLWLRFVSIYLLQIKFLGDTVKALFPESLLWFSFVIRVHPRLSAATFLWFYSEA